MKKTFHLCLSSKEEVMFRSEDDYRWAFNTCALALARTESESLAYAHMSNHQHHVVRTSRPGKFMQSMRLSYTRHFNAKYGRRGPLGEGEFFCLEIEGINHLLAALSYVKRNALHHGVAPTPFSYPYSSANSIFSRERGLECNETLLHRRHYHRFVGRNVEVPEHYRMTESGLFMPADVLDVRQVEHIFVTPRSFLYYMNRLSGEEWIREQTEDPGGNPPITVDTIEEGTALTTAEMLLRNEKGRADYQKMTDMRLCSEIDGIVSRYFGVKSVYALSYSQRTELYKMVCELYPIDDRQARRCVAIDYQ